MECPDADAESVSAIHGDRLRLTFAIDRDRLTEVRFQCLGCTVAIAAGSVATVLLTGRSVEHALALTDAEVAEALGGVPAGRVECSLLVRRTVHAALGRRPT